VFEDSAHVQDDDEDEPQLEEATDSTEQGPSNPVEQELEVLEQSGSQRAIENLLKVYYEPLELWFLRTSVEKVSVYTNPLTAGSPSRITRHLVTAILVLHPG
jgi:hypothetical protein